MLGIISFSIFIHLRLCHVFACILEGQRKNLLTSDVANLFYYQVGHRISRTMKTAYNQDLNNQIYCLEQISKHNAVVKDILNLAPKLRMPNWYLGAGCIAQTVWNVQHGFNLAHGIKDYDLVYYDSSDTSSEGENIYIRRGKELFKDVTAEIEIKNEARVHLWYKNHFGYSIKQYKSINEAINTWPTTATSVAVKYDDKGRFVVYAPYGLNDLFGMVVRPNKTQITEEIYMKKVERWTKIWHKLTVIPWHR